ncbi:MAG: 50S ribosomal protein L10 [Spirochaetota bacterium]|nr:50S ribosomal protein L10 [Spirochaetota bacterium]
MIKQYKIDRVAELVNKLQMKRNIILTDYSGIKVKDLSSLRMKLREKGIDYKVIKNNIFNRALQEAGFKDISNFLKGPIAVAFTNQDLSDAAKMLKEFGKEQENFSYFLGVMDDVIYEEDSLKRIADLPSKEILIGKIMSLLNTPATMLSQIINQSIASLARGIQAVAEKN